jgi:hypothetical protein
MDSQALISKIGDLWQIIVAYLSDKVWLKALQNIFEGLDWIKQRNLRGLYEVLNYEATLELNDRKGKKASVTKVEMIRYLQDTNIAFQDQAWGDGKILLYYRCSPGIPVDTYRSGFKTHILISLRQVKNRGDIDEFHIHWGIHDGFLKPTGFWASEISHPTDKITMRVIFPPTRPPLSASILEKNRQRSTSLGRENFLALPDGNSEITWECNKPTLYEQYILNWEW